MGREEDGDNLKKKANNRKSILSLSKYLNLGWSLVAPLILGVVLGIYLDRLFSTKIVFILGGIMLGFVVSIYNLWKLTKNN